MQGKLNSKVVGATVVGFAIVIGAYTISSINSDKTIPKQQAAAKASEPEPRVAITVLDENQNGIEDWRDEFITTEPIVITESESTVEYEPPTTLTGQLGVNFFQDYFEAKSNGPFGRADEEIINNTIEVLEAQTAYDLYDTPDITIMPAATDADILTYANTIALAITNNNIDNIEDELTILKKILEDRQPSPADISKLQAIASAYQSMRDQTLATPVPSFLAKAHLDLINSYHAIYNDIEAMVISVEDPALALMRLKRYEDDATALSYALQNMYDGLLPYAALLGP